MRIAAYNGHSGQRETSFGSYHVDDAVLRIHHAEMCQTEFLGICGKCINLRLTDRIFDRLVLIVSGCIMVGHAEDTVGAEAFQSSRTHSFESLRRCHLMTVKPIDIKLFGTSVNILYYMTVPNLVE